MNLTYVPTTVVVAVVADSFIVINFGFAPPRHPWLVSALDCMLFGFIIS